MSQRTSKHASKHTSQAHVPQRLQIIKRSSASLRKCRRPSCWCPPSRVHASHRAAAVHMSKHMSKYVSKHMSKHMSKYMSKHTSKHVSKHVSKYVSKHMSKYSHGHRFKTRDEHTRKTTGRGATAATTQVANGGALGRRRGPKYRVETYEYY